MPARYLIVIFTLLIALSSPAFSEETGYAVVLVYHRFGDPRYPSTSVSIEDFKKQMQYLKESGFTVVSLPEFLNFLKEGRFPGKIALITIDDGYKSTLKAYKVLKKFNYPFVLFLYMEAVDRYPDFLTKSEIEDMLKSRLLYLGLHSYSHYSLHRKGFSKEDLYKGIERFKKLFGYTPKVYSYPYGEYSKDAVDEVSRIFSAAFTQDLGTVDNCTNPYLIPRIPVVGSWSTLERFKKLINLRPLCIKDITYGFVPEKFYIRITLPKSFDSCFFYTSSSGWKKIESKRMLDTTITVKEKQRIGIRCIRKGHIYQRLWLVMPR